MQGSKSWQNALAKIDEVNSTDPRMDNVEGEPFPRELHFSRRMAAWVERLVDSPSSHLLVAARGFSIGRWEIPRDQYPMTTPGYHKWRKALAQHHAERTAELLGAEGLPESDIHRVQDLIMKKDWPNDEETCVLEDASCLAFLEIKLSAYLDTWDKEKMLRILSGTIRKMTPQARRLALEIDLPQRGMELVLEAHELATV